MSSADPRQQPLRIPALGVVALVGVSGSGKTTFARKHFAETEVLSSDTCRGWVADDQADQSATDDAFAVLYDVAERRLRRAKLTVIDATSVQPFARKVIVALARSQHVHASAVVLDLPLELCLQRNAARGGRKVPQEAIRQQHSDLRQSLDHLKQEGFRTVYVLDSEAAVAAARFERTRMAYDRTDDRGPFDIIGDVHGCADELKALLGELGYRRTDRDGAEVFAHPHGRRALFLGDLCDRGPATPEVYRTVVAMVRHNAALCLPGNHDVKLLRWLQGRNVRLTHGLDRSVQQFQAEPESFRNEIAAFIDRLISHFVLDQGNLVVAHAGLKESMQGRPTAGVREFCLYGETTGEIDELGLPVRVNWAEHYRGRALVVYGHTPVPSVRWRNNAVCIDTGCVFGGALTALRYPEREIVAVPAARAYFESPKSQHPGASEPTGPV
ncbi:MAG: AAA family ATPase [Deltaproteobacteria bacterium]|nr:AAA family ATPase [Deltaproteobacteria bacterium]